MSIAKNLVEQVNLFINNQEFATGKDLEIRDPGKRSDIAGRVSIGDASHVDQAVTAAHQAFLSWRNTDVKERVQLVLQAAHIIKESAQELAPFLVREHGGMLWEANLDFYLGEHHSEFYAGVAESFLKPEQSEDERSWISSEKTAKGVIAAIVPWNMPIVLTMNKLAPALLMGNTIVVKPSPTAPLILSVLLQRIAAFFPAGVINVVHGNADVGEALTSHPLVRKVAFTGGTETGKKVMASAAKGVKNVTLELGGNDPAIILDDVNNLDEIVTNILKATYMRSGQICFAVKRVYVPESLYDKFYNIACELSDEYKVGHGLNEQSSFGPLNSEKQYNFVKELIHKAKHNGATVRELGQKVDPDGWNDGYYILPHVIRDVNPGEHVVSCEQFGPVLPIVSYKNVDQAIEMANNCELGLCSSVWSSDHERALAVARRVEAGTTFINRHTADSLKLPMLFGGVKQSGIGRELAVHETLNEYIDHHFIRTFK